MVTMASILIAVGGLVSGVILGLVVWLQVDELLRRYQQGRKLR